MIDWLNGMSPRERYMVIGCAGFLLLAMLWAFGLQPLLKLGSGLEERVIQKRGQLASLQELASRVDPASPGSRAIVGGSDSLVVIIDRTTRQKQLAAYLKRNQPEGPGSVRLRLEGAPFDILVNWLGELSDRYGMTIANASIDATDTGRVNASLVIARTGG
jgi:type II secretory pathway component PulM